MKIQIGPLMWSHMIYCSAEHVNKTNKAKK